MANTMTYATAIDFAIKALGDTNSEAVDRLTALKAQLAKRGSGSKKGMTKTQKENEVIMGRILATLEEEERFLSMADFRSEGLFPDLSTQKMGALLKKLVDNGKAQKVIYKKKAFYAVPELEFVAPDAKEGNDSAEEEDA